MSITAIIISYGGGDEKNMKILTQDVETGTVIDSFTSIEEATQAIEMYEAEDMGNNSYTPNFYEIRVIE